MEKLHGDDFVRIRALGSLGDKGCDGYLVSNGQVFQCYGKLEDTPVRAASIVKKLDDDYTLAASHLIAIMKEWHFAHNLVNGLPTEAVLKIEAMKTAFPQHQFGTGRTSGTRRTGVQVERRLSFRLARPGGDRRGQPQFANG